LFARVNFWIEDLATNSVRNDEACRNDLDDMRRPINMSLCVLARHITLDVVTSAECATLLNASESKALTVRMRNKRRIVSNVLIVSKLAV